jgi:hypothetical protein
MPDLYELKTAIKAYPVRFSTAINTRYLFGEINGINKVYTSTKVDRLAAEEG